VLPLSLKHVVDEEVTGHHFSC